MYRARMLFDTYYIRYWMNPWRMCINQAGISWFRFIHLSVLVPLIFSISLASISIIQKFFHIDYFVKLWYLIITLSVSIIIPRLSSEEFIQEYKRTKVSLDELKKMNLAFCRKCKRQYSRSTINCRYCKIKLDI